MFSLWEDSRKMQHDPWLGEWKKKDFKELYSYVEYLINLIFPFF